MIRRSIGKLRRAARWSKNRPRRGVLILLYHRVTELRSDPWRMCVTPRHFVEHLEVLREHTHLISLRQLSQVLLDGNLPNRSVVVTFDDGYADNLYNAKPALERYGIPATFFLTTGQIGQEREFWWDELERLLLQPDTLPKTLSLNINGTAYRWELGKAARYSEKFFWRRRGWRAYEAAPPSPRHSAYCSLWELLNPLSEGERRKVLGELRTWAGAGPAARPTHRPLLREEAVALAQGELIEVGAHTVTHPALSALPAASQRDEVQRSKAYLEEVLSGQVTSFAYPYGKQYHYTAETVSIVREAGFSCACSNFVGVAGQSTDPFQLPRVAVADQDGRRFARRLSRWFRG